MVQRLGKWFVGLILSCIVSSDVRSADPILAAQKRAARGMFLSLVSSAAFCGFALATAPDGSTSDGLASVTAMIQQRVAAGFGIAALVASVVGLYFIVRYVLVVKWPERFVDLSE
jgi:hypothetical protein